MSGYEQGPIWLVGCLLVAGGLLSSCSTVRDTVTVAPEVPGATFVGNAVCYDCHTNYVRGFPSSPHARVHLATARLEGGSGCESCHGPGSRHVEVGGGRGQFIINPGRDPAACFECHLETRADFHLPERHPVVEGKMNCVNCHDPHGLDIFKPAPGLAMARLNESCAQCHREQSRLVVFEHLALREGCTVCHAPHGSVNRKMLVTPDPNLCLRCHAQVQNPLGGRGQLVIGKVDHTGVISSGGCWSAGCHTAVHGSNINPHLLY